MKEQDGLGPLVGRTVRIVRSGSDGDEEKETITTREPLSSVELREDSKGVVHPAVKVYAADPREAARIALQLGADLGMAVVPPTQITMED